jgi:hypothetical protein
MRKVGSGLLFIGACSACWVAPLLIALLGAGWAGALGASWIWMIAVAAVVTAGLVAARRIQRRRAAACNCSP